MTAWPEYSKITNNHIKNMEKRVIIDSRRILKNSKLDCNYQAIGIGS
jgi:UDP-N-acetyl-D-mannosaminuronate dehydrogenase